MLKISQNVKKTINPPIVALADIAHQLKKEGKDVISLGQAIPDLPINRTLLKEAKESLSKDFINFYSTDRGLIELRDIIAQKLLTQNGRKVIPEKEILITAGANQAAFSAFLTILDHGDEVIIPSPFYFNHEMGVRIAGAHPIEWKMNEDENGFSLDINKLEKLITGRTKAITIVTPNNPTGAIYNRETLEKVAQIALKNNLFIIADETYEKILFDSREHFSIGSIEYIKDNVITISSFSKTFSITGWRLGYIVANSTIIEEMLKVHDTMIICAPVISQVIGIKAIEDELNTPRDKSYLYDFILELEKRKKVLHNLVNETALFEWREPHGALFTFIKYKKNLGLSEPLAFDMLKKSYVSLMPGSSFGEYGEYHFRISFGSVNIKRMEEAFYRIKDYFKA